MHNNALAVLFAFASALTIAWGTVVRHKIATEARHSEHTIRSAMKKPLWWAGTSTALIAYGLQAIALGFGTLLAVQPVLVLKLMLSLPMSARYTGHSMSKKQMSWALALTIAVCIIILFGRPIPSTEQPLHTYWLPALLIGCILITLLIYLSNSILSNKKALILGTAVGAIFGYVSLFSKASIDLYLGQGLLALLWSWEFYALILAAIIGTIMQQYAFNAGSLKESLPAMTIGEPICAFILGYLILGEKFQATGLEWILMGIALIIMVLSTFALSRESTLGRE